MNAPQENQASTTDADSLHSPEAEARTQREKLFVYIFIFLSGASALLYEVAWVRMMGLVVGSTTQAASCVIAAFLGGLALGGWLAGRVMSARKLPFFLTYGCLELGIAVTAPCVSFLLQGAPLTFATLTSQLPSGTFWLTAERLIFASILLLPPTVLMGATLPIVTEFLVKHYAKPAHYFSVLYGLNTLGAVTGSLASVYLIFPYLGLFNSIMLAAAVNLSIAITVFALASAKSFRSANDSPAAVEEEDGKINLVVTDGTFALSRGWLNMIAALLGVTALSYEILWIRLLRVYLGSTTYAFSAMVSTFLLGLVAGSFIYNRKLKEVPDFCSNLNAQLKMLSLSQMGAAVLSWLGLLILPSLTVVQAFAKVINGGNDLSPEVSLIFWSILAFALLIAPSTFIGLAFPLIGGLASSSARSVVKAVGTTYAANTVGCIFGSLISGLVLIPTVGTPMTMQLVAFANAACAFFIEKKIGQTKRLRVAIALVAVIGTSLIFLPLDYPERVYAKLTQGDILAVKEDPIGRVLCLKYNRGNRLLVNGTMYSGDMAHSLRYMRSLAHFPVLLNKNPEDVLVVCFGIGSTAGAVAKHPEVKHLDVCEISPAVLSCGDLFAKTNDGVLHKEKVSFQLEDGRNYLLRTKKKYDVISFEPPPPVDAGIVNLYSKDFYEICKRHLKPGGIVCQWAPMHAESSIKVWNAMVKAADAFSHVQVWLPSSLDPVIIASESEVKLDPQNIASRIDASPELKKSLTDIGLADPFAIAATYFIGEEEAKKYLADTPEVTDDRPNLEFFLPLSGPPKFPIDLQSCQSDVRKIMPELSSSEDQKLQRFLKIAQLLKEASKLTWTSHVDEAKAKYREALSLDPDNKYLQSCVEHPDMK
ncbi:MAG TPA: fused MFS/spermidine synthase [Candidatus Melainabacteria bacterium]|nr:fused MFS/spermidine synthase [Candidatus Melainabacteria bacterium]